jgi:hypothetical protein
MALLLAGEDRTVIQLVGRWKSDAFFTYLHGSALPLIQHHAHKMLKHGSFTIMRGDLTLPAANNILEAHFQHPTGPETA